MEPGGLWWTNVLNFALPPQRLRPDTRLEHQDPVSHTAEGEVRVLSLKLCLGLPGLTAVVEQTSEVPLFWSYISLSSYGRYLDKSWYSVKSKFEAVPGTCAHLLLGAA